MKRIVDADMICKCKKVSTALKRFFKKFPELEKTWRETLECMGNDGISFLRETNDNEWGWALHLEVEENNIYVAIIVREAEEAEETETAAETAAETAVEAEERKEEKTMEKRKILESVKEEIEMYYTGFTTESGEEKEFYHYLAEEVLDFSIMLNSSFEYKSCKVYVALGGPNIWIDTEKKVIKLAWGCESCDIGLSDTICEEIDEYFEELYSGR